MRVREGGLAGDAANSAAAAAEGERGNGEGEGGSQDFCLSVDCWLKGAAQRADALPHKIPVDTG